MDSELDTLTGPIDAVLRSARMQTDHLGGVLLVGAGARSPALVAAVQSRVGAGVSVVSPPNPEEAVARGASLAPKMGWVG